MPKVPAAQRSESTLRDHLAKHLDLVEPDLTLVRTEYPLRNDQGSGGFVDILARDSRGDLVIIELKRSDQTARQALHELEKYVGLLAADRGIRVDRLWCILLSTSWHELLVPFSRFVRHADFHVVGRLLCLGADGFAVGSERVELPSLASGLENCPMHLHLLFTNEDARDRAAPTVVATLAELFVEDFITVDLNYVGESPHIIFPFGLYLIVAEFTDALRDFVRSEFPADCEDEPSDSPWWHEQLVQGSVVNAVRADTVEVGSPEQFAALNDWEAKAVTGHGRYAERLVWPDAQLLRAVRASGETFSMPFKREVTVANKPAWARTRKNLDRCLMGAGEWPGLVSGLLDEIERHSSAELMIHAYVPNDLLFGLQRLASTGGSEYIPQLLIGWKNPSMQTLIGGTLRWDGMTRVTTPRQTLGRLFGDFLGYMVARATGSLWELETALCELHGLSYEIVETTASNDTKKLSKVELGPEGRLTRTPVKGDEPTAEEFVAAHRSYLIELAAVFEKNSIGLPG